MTVKPNPKAEIVDAYFKIAIGEQHSVLREVLGNLYDRAFLEGKNEAINQTSQAIQFSPATIKKWIKKND